MTSSREEEPQTKVQEDIFLSLFGGLLDEMDTERIENQSKPATKAEIRSLMGSLNGFKYWDNLIEDCRRQVVEYLEYGDRTRLGICSKRDYATVKSTPLYVHQIQIYDHDKHHFPISGDEFDNVVVRIQFHPNYYNEMNIHRIFSPLGEDTRIRWIESKPRKRPANKSIVKESCNYYMEAVKFAEGWMKWCNFEVENLKVEMSYYPFETSIIKSFPKCVRFRTIIDEVESFRWWLQKFPNPLRLIQLFLKLAPRAVFILPSDLLDSPQIMTATRLHLGCRADFTDEQLRNLNANWICFDSVNITDQGINQFIKRWVNGSDFDFKKVFLFLSEERNLEEMTRGLVVRQWDAEFRDEAGDFCREYEWLLRHGTFVQIPNRVDPYESLTLSFSTDRLSIHATGHRSIRDGITCTEYSPY